MGSAMPDVTDGADTAPVFEVELVIEDSSYPFVGASEAEACRFELAEIVPGPASSARSFSTSGTGIRTGSFA